MSESVFAAAARCIFSADPDEKCQLSERVYLQLSSQQLSFTDTSPALAIEVPGRPAKPALVPVKMLAHRKIGTELGRASLLHAIAHIEFNAINLAWDAVYRFRELPEQYYQDWAKVAKEEAYHFSLLNQRLNALGYAYGDFDAHDGLWEMACRTDHDVLVRMALVPRVLEARGLDVAPSMMQRLKKVGDQRSADILEIIFRDEIGHVEIGSYWYRYFCEQRGVNSVKTFKQLLATYMEGSIRGPFEYDARIQAGFTEMELTVLDELSEKPRHDI